MLNSAPTVTQVPLLTPVSRSSVISVPFRQIDADALASNSDKLAGFMFSFGLDFSSELVQYALDIIFRPNLISWISLLQYQGPKSISLSLSSVLIELGVPLETELRKMESLGVPNLQNSIRLLPEALEYFNYPPLTVTNTPFSYSLWVQSIRPETDLLFDALYTLNMPEYFRNLLILQNGTDINQFPTTRRNLKNLCAKLFAPAVLSSSPQQGVFYDYF